MLTETLKQKLFSAIMKTYQTNGYVTWKPFTPDRLLPYYYTEFVHRLLSCVKKIEHTDHNLADILSRLSHVINLRDELHAILAYWGEGNLHISEKELNDMAGFIIWLFLYISEEEPFSENGHLRILSNEQIDSLVKSIDWNVSSLEIARELGKVAAIAKSLSWSLYTDVWANAAGDMYHGPYPAGEKGQLIIRDYMDLAPTELWAHTNDWNIKRIRILMCYDPTTDLHIDFEGALSSNSNLIEHLLYWAIEINGRPIERSEITSVYQSLIDYLSAQVKVTGLLDLEGLKKWFLESHCYFEKELLTLAKIDWKPDNSMYSSIINKPLLPEVEDLIESRNKSLRRAIEKIIF